MGKEKRDAAARLHRALEGKDPAAILQAMAGGALPSVGPEQLSKLEQPEGDGLVQGRLGRSSLGLAKRMRSALKTPIEWLQELEVTLEGMGPLELPAGFDFPGMTPAIQIDPGNYQFETDRDGLNWLAEAGPPVVAGWLGLDMPKAPFRYAHAAESGFVYPLDDGRVTELGVFGDFGTGLYHSRYIARHLGHYFKPHYTFHLGDVYYRGTRQEFTEYFDFPLTPVCENSQFFALNGNHEMYSGGLAYFQSMDARRQNFKRSVQEGSYFCLQGKHFCILGLDTAYFDDGRLKEPHLVQWLDERLEHAREEGLITILLTSNHPYAQNEAGVMPLLESDLHQLVVKEKSVDLWLWGNTHYAGLFDRSQEFPFIGICAGHGGYPYGVIRPEEGSECPAPIRFLERAPRFPVSTGVRQDRGNHGFVSLELRPGLNPRIDIRFIDWMRRLRAKFSLGRGATGRFEVQEQSVYEEAQSPYLLGLQVGAWPRHA